MVFRFTTITALKRDLVPHLIGLGRNVRKDRGAFTKGRPATVVIPTGSSQTIEVAGQEMRIEDFRPRDDHEGGVNVTNHTTRESFNIGPGGRRTLFNNNLIIKHEEDY